MKKFRSIACTLLLVLSFVLLSVLVLTRIQGKTPYIFGYQLLRVSSDSMSPELEYGDIILSKSVGDIYDVKIGDIIVYKGQVDSYSGKLITHQVVLGPYVENGNIYLETMGIANGYTDPVISAEQVTGKMICTLPFLSAVYGFFTTPWGLMTVLAVLALLFINELFALKKLIKEDKNIGFTQNTED